MANYAYIRVSHKDSSQGLSPESQLELARSVHSLLGGEWGECSYPLIGEPGIFQDIVQSAWKKPLARRPGGQTLLRILKPGDRVIFYSIDRGFRSVADFSLTVKDWMSRGIKCYFIREQIDLSSANGLAIGHVIAAMAEWQSHVKSERIREAKAAAKARIKTSKAKDERVRWDQSEFDFSVRDAEPKKAGTIHRYIRVSHAYQVAGVSPESQDIITLKYSEYIAKANPGLIVGSKYVDSAVSAYKTTFAKRAAGGELDRMLQDGDHVVVARLDRGWRSTQDLLATISDWNKRGVTAHFADSHMSSRSPSGRVFLTLLGVLAEMESDFKSRQSLEVNCHLRKVGRPCGEIPWGYRTGTYEGSRRLVPDIEKIKIAKLTRKMRDRYGMSWRKLSDRIERLLAAMEKRKAIPQSGVMIGGQGKRSITGLKHRKYTPMVLRKAYKMWPKLEGIWNKIRKIESGLNSYDARQGA